MAGPRFSGVFLYLCLCVSSCQHNLNHSQCMYWRMSQFLQRTGQAMNKDAQVRHSTQLVLFIFKLFHIFNVRNWMDKSSCLWRLSLTGSWGGGLEPLPSTLEREGNTWTGHQSDILNREAQTSLFPATSSNLSWGTWVSPPRETPRKHPSQVSKPPGLSSFTVEE